MSDQAMRLDNDDLPGWMKTVAVVLAVAGWPYNILASYLQLYSAGWRMVGLALTLAAMAGAIFLYLVAPQSQRTSMKFVVVLAFLLPSTALGFQAARWSVATEATPGDLALADKYDFNDPGREAIFDEKLATSGGGKLSPTASWWVTHRNSDGKNESGGFLTFTRAEESADGSGWFTKDIYIGSAGDCGKKYVLYLIAIPINSALGLDEVKGTFTLQRLPRGAESLASVRVQRTPCAAKPGG